MPCYAIWVRRDHMSKVICDICGTSYQETADSCPICGYTRILGLDELAEDIAEDETIITRNKGGRFAQTAMRKKNKAIFDYDEVNSDDDDDEEDEDDDYGYEEEDYEEASRSSSAVIVILVVVIMLLLATAGFLFLRFFLPNMLADEPAPTTQVTVPVETETEATTEPTIPCRSIALTGGIVRGMSGSPIIQNGKLVGAVTHVMVANPTEGYGIFIENMLNAAQQGVQPKAA